MIEFINILFVNYSYIINEKKSFDTYYLKLCKKNYFKIFQCCDQCCFLFQSFNRVKIVDEIRKADITSLKATCTGIDSIVKVCFLKIGENVVEIKYLRATVSPRQFDEYNNGAVEASLVSTYSILLIHDACKVI